MPGIAVVVVWAGRFPQWASQTLTSIEAQRPPPVERVLVIDHPGGIEATQTLAADPRDHGWTVLHGEWNDPAAARNAGISQTSAQWLVFFDADNVMAPEYLAAVGRTAAAADSRVAILYPDICYTGPDLDGASTWRVPEYDYWSLRAANFIDTSAAWRREVLELAGGWPTGFSAFEDYALALEITRRGWTAQRGTGPPVIVRVHDGTRSAMSDRTASGLTDVWRARTLAIVSLLAGRRTTVDRWADFLRVAELPPHTSLYVVDNSGDAAFGADVVSICTDLARDRRLEQLTILPRPRCYGGQADEPYFTRERHLHIAGLYSDVLPRVTEDLVFTLEDDIEPAPDAIRRLGERIGFTVPGRQAAVAGAYDMGPDGGLCAGQADGGWGSPIFWHDLTEQPMIVGNVGGGCTMWAGWALNSHPVPFHWEEGLGWDGSLCGQLRAHSYDIELHGGVRCTHHVHGAVRT